MILTIESELVTTTKNCWMRTKGFILLARVSSAYPNGTCLIYIIWIKVCIYIYIYMGIYLNICIYICYVYILHIYTYIYVCTLCCASVFFHYTSVTSLLSGDRRIEVAAMEQLGLEHPSSCFNIAATFCNCVRIYNTSL